MVPVSIRSGNTDVIASGIVISTAPEAEIELSLHPLPGTPVGASTKPLVIRFAFEDDPKNPTNTAIRGESSSESLRLVLVNFSNPLGTGTTEMIRIGTIASPSQKMRLLYIHFRVYSLGTGPKTLQYTFYAGEEVADA